MIIEVIPEAKSYKSNTFSYLVPPELESGIQVGSIVTIPFGKKIIRGLIVRIQNTEYRIKQKYLIKDIISVEPLFIIHPSYFKVIDWIAEHYFCSHGEALTLFLPPEMKRPPKDDSIKGNIKPIHDNLKKLSDSQVSIYQNIIKSSGTMPHLIHGVTGSGKTEIYIQLCLDTISRGKSCVILVPEIILTPQNIERFNKVFSNNVALIHSNLSQGERYSAYRDFYQGNKQIIIGPRSALLIPNANIGLIIIDEEHEDSYKQDQSPRYHAVDLAEKIAHKIGATLVLGSATPRIESFFKASCGQYQLHQLSNRYNKLLMPPAEIVDLKNEIKLNNFSSISIKLQAALTQILKNKKQAILFLNRRGSSTFVSCRDCGEVINCPNCDIPLIHHINTRSYLYCHHCDYRAHVPSICPKCGSVKIKFFGAGVEKVEHEVREIFPKARIARVDAENIKNKADYEKFYQDFKNHRFDVAIGTQMISKGFDIPHVDLVGIISADTGLHLPYFRASEKVFRLVTQVSGRSGRGNHPGQTIIQTYWPASHAIVSASRHDFMAFYESEIINREKHGYPPFSHLLRIISEHEKPDKARAELDKVLPIMDQLNIEYIGPGPCFFQRLRGRWRYHIIIKLPRNLDNNQFPITNFQSNYKPQNPNNKVGILKPLRDLWKENLNLIWDMDPIDLL